MASSVPFAERLEHRYDYLAVCAHRRRMDQDKRYVYEMTPGQMAFSDAMYDLKVLEELDAEMHPVLSGLQREYRTKPLMMRLKATLECMLSAGKPYRERFFLLTNGHLRKWYREHGINSSTNSVQGNIVFFVDCGLLEKSSTVLNGKRTRLLAPVRWTEDVLEHSEEIGRLYKERGARLNALSKTDVIRVRGQERADALYTTEIAPDKRTIRKINAYVYQVFKEETLRLIGENEYTRLSEVESNAWRRIEQEQGFALDEDVDPFNLTFEEGKYRREFKRVLARKDQALKEIGCLYHCIRRTDIERYGLAGKSWIITRE